MDKLYIQWTHATKSTAKNIWLLIWLCLALDASHLRAAEPPAATGHSTNQAQEKTTGPTSPVFGAPLSLADALNLALHQSPIILRAQKELEASQGVVIQTRAIALPTVGIAGSYGAVERTDIDIFELPTFTFGTPQNWSA